MSELAYVDWLRRRTAADPRAPVGIGDDAAVVIWPSGQLVVTTDMALEGSCFRLEGTEPKLIGRKAMAVNLSDLAAMAAKPVAAVVSMAFPRSASAELSQGLFLGLEAMAAEFGVALVGGDTNSWNGPLAINVTLFGEVTGSGPVLRRGAQPGDWLFVTGPLGGSILGHHLKFTPRVKEALALHQAAKLKAMIDLSDGLALDLRRLGAESRCGARLFVERLPISAAAQAMNDGKTPLEHALGDGEDFELLFAVAAETGKTISAAQPLRALGVTLHHIGEATPNGFTLRRADGNEAELPRLGYEHQFGD